MYVCGVHVRVCMFSRVLMHACVWKSETGVGQLPPLLSTESMSLSPPELVKLPGLATQRAGGSSVSVFRDLGPRVACPDFYVGAGDPNSRCLMCQQVVCHRTVP